MRARSAPQNRLHALIFHVAASALSYELSHFSIVLHIFIRKSLAKRVVSYIVKVMTPIALNFVLIEIDLFSF